MSTEYIILRTEGDRWYEVANFSARSALSAIREAVDADPNGASGSSYVAVPARSWKPVTVKVETKTALKFS